MRWSETLVLIRSDLDRLRSAINEGNAAPGRIRTLILLLTPESFSLALYRLSHYFRQRGWHRAAAFLYRLNLTLTGLDIHPDTRIGPGCLVVHPVGTVLFGTFGARLSIYARVIVAADLLRGQLDDAPVIGDDLVIGSMASVIGPVSIADRVRISTCSLVNFSVSEADTMVKCIPGDKVILTRKPNHSLPGHKD